MRARKNGTRPRRWQPGKAQIEALIEDAIADAYGDSEQRTGFFTMIEEHLALPFETEVLGTPVTVERIAMTDDEQLVAICRRGRSRQSVPLLDLPLPTPRPAGAEWIASHRHWLGEDSSARVPQAVRPAAAGLR